MDEKLKKQVIGRVVDEHTLLDEKVKFLDNFLCNPKSDVDIIGKEQQDLLIIQLGVMKSYRTILEMRLDNFNKVKGN